MRIEHFFKNFVCAHVTQFTFTHAASNQAIFRNSTERTIPVLVSTFDSFFFGDYTMMQCKSVNCTFNKLVTCIFGNSYFGRFLFFSNFIKNCLAYSVYRFAVFYIRFYFRRIYVKFTAYCVDCAHTLTLCLCRFGCSFGGRLFCHIFSNHIRLTVHNGVFVFHCVFLLCLLDFHFYIP